MKDLFFAKDLLAALRNDKFYSDPKNLANALRKFHLHYDERAENREQMFRTLVAHIIEQRGETEPFLTESFIYPEGVLKLLKEHKLPAPAALQPETTTKKDSKQPLEQAQFEKHFDNICRNCGTVTDPLGNSYRTPIGRLIFRTYLETLRTQGVKTTGWYVFSHLKDFDTEKVITSVQEDYVTWKTEDSKEKMTSLHTISKFVLRLDREVEKILH